MLIAGTIAYGISAHSITRRVVSIHSFLYMLAGMLVAIVSGPLPDGQDH